MLKVMLFMLFIRLETGGCVSKLAWLIKAEMIKHMDGSLAAILFIFIILGYTIFWFLFAKEVYKEVKRRGG